MKDPFSQLRSRMNAVKRASFPGFTVWFPDDTAEYSMALEMASDGGLHLIHVTENTFRVVNYSTGSDSIAVICEDQVNAIENAFSSFTRPGDLHLPSFWNGYTTISNQDVMLARLAIG